MKLGFIMVLTPDITEAAGFYRDVLGLALTDRTPNQLVFDLDGTELRVFQCDEPAAERLHASAATTVCIFEVPSIDDAMRQLKEKGMVFIHETPNQDPHGGFRYAAFHAPGGNVHEIMERREAT